MITSLASLASRSAGLLRYAGLAACMVLVGPAGAQQPDNSAALLTQKVSVSFETTSLTAALRSLMGTQLNANYVVDNGLRGAVVTAELHDVTLKTALAAILNASSIPATYSLQDGVYYFKPGTETMPIVTPEVTPTVQPAAQADETWQVIWLQHADPADFITQIGGRLIRVNYQNYGILGGRSGNGGGGLPGQGSGNALVGNGAGMTGSFGNGSLGGPGGTGFGQFGGRNGGGVGPGAGSGSSGFHF